MAACGRAFSDMRRTRRSIEPPPEMDVGDDQLGAVAAGKRGWRGSPVMRAAVVIPNWNGAKWLPGCLDAIVAQTRRPDEVIVVDDASQDDSVAVAQAHPLAPHRARARGQRRLRPGGEQRHSRRGRGCRRPVNVDVVLAADWLERTVRTLEDDPQAAAVATKMVAMEDPGILDDTGDFLRRDARRSSEGASAATRPVGRARGGVGRLRGRRALPA
jgi:glycosyltransferase involved in cell wall biosynthesis